MYLKVHKKCNNETWPVKLPDTEMTTSSWCIIWHQVYNDGEYKTFSVIAGPRQYLQIISIVSPPCGVIQATL